MEHRNRAEGWKHAKNTGHKNEELVKMRLDTDIEFASRLLLSLDKPNDKIVETIVGGLREKDVMGVNNKKTKSKTDLKIILNTKESINISIKKSLGGQAYLVRAGLFIDTFNKQFNTQIPSDVCRAIDLFWSGAEDALDIIKQYGDNTNANNYNLQLRHKSLNATTLKTYNAHLYKTLLQWFIDNSYKITKLSFSMGAAKDSKEWANFIWYINLLGENEISNIFSIEDICNASQKYAKENTYFSTKNGGTTIQLPFGFVQWHQKQLQFHHDRNKIWDLLNCTVINTR